MKSWLVICFLIGVVGCGGDPASQPNSPQAVQVVDSLARTVRLPSLPKRIVSLSSANTEILYTLGVEDDIVGVTEFCTYPPDATKKQKVGGFAPQSFSLETIAALKPDLVLTAGVFHQPVIDSLERLNIPVAAFDATSFADIYHIMEQIGTLVGKADIARQNSTAMRMRLARTSQRIGGRPRPNVFYLVSDDPLMTVGQKSFLSEAIVAGGGQNVFADLPDQYPRISHEQVLRRNPTVILYPKQGHDGRTHAPKALEELEAVKAKRIHGITADLISRPSPRLVEAVEEIAEILHPTR